MSQETERTSALPTVVLSGRAAELLGSRLVLLLVTFAWGGDRLGVRADLAERLFLVFLNQSGPRQAEHRVAFREYPRPNGASPPVQSLREVCEVGPPTVFRAKDCKSRGVGFGLPRELRGLGEEGFKRLDQRVKPLSSRLGIRQLKRAGWSTAKPAENGEPRGPVPRSEVLSPPDPDGKRGEVRSG